MSTKWAGVYLTVFGAVLAVVGCLALLLPGARGFALWLAVPGAGLLVAGSVLLARARREGQGFFPTQASFLGWVRAQYIHHGVLGLIEIGIGILLVVDGSGWGWIWIALGVVGIIMAAVVLRSGRPSKRWPQPDLEAGETVIWGSVAQHASARLAPAGGLSLTDRRLVFTLLSTERGYGLMDAEWPVTDLASVAASETEWSGLGTVKVAELLVTLRNGTVERFTGMGVEAGEEPIRRLVDAAMPD